MSNRTYFLGCPTPDGFETHLGDDIKSGKFFTYIIKGGPGTGKSTLMKRLAAVLSDVDPAELYYCSSDPDSLDAVVFRKLGVIFVDGTAPHVFEPSYPGARERLLDLGRFWDENILRACADEIIRCSDENAKLHLRVKRCLGAICSLNADILAASEAALLGDKLEAYAKRLSLRLMPKTGRAPGKISLRQITTVTPKGIVTQAAAFEGCTVYAVSDPYYAVTDALLKSLSVRAAAAGYDVVVSKNVFHGGCVYEHAVIPELGLAFVSGETAGELADAKINALRFYDRDLLRERRRRYLFNTGVKRELTASAIETLEQAKAVHDDLERCYIGAMDFGAIEAVTAELAQKLRG